MELPGFYFYKYRISAIIYNTNAHQKVINTYTAEFSALERVSFSLFLANRPSIIWYTEFFSSSSSSSSTRSFSIKVLSCEFTSLKISSEENSSESVIPRAFAIFSTVEVAERIQPEAGAIFCRAQICKFY